MKDIIRYSLVFNRRGSLDRRGRGIVSVCLSQFGQRTYYSTSIRLFPEQWDKRRQRVKPTAVNSVSTNRYLLHLLEKMQDIALTQLNNKGSVTVGEVLDIVKAGERPLDFATFLRRDFLPSRKVAEATIRNYQGLANYLSAFRPGLYLSEVTYAFIEKFAAYLHTRMSINSAGKNLNLLKGVITDAVRRGLLSRNPFENYKINKENRTRFPLTPEEIRLFESYETTDKIKRQACDKFLFQVYTGLRHSDVLQVKPENLSHNEGYTVLSLVTKKTKVPVIIPISALYNGKPLRILERYCRGSSKPYFTLDIKRTNLKLKEIAQELGILRWKDITTHIGRHTLGTDLLRLGLPLHEVQMILGHTNITQTQAYAKTSPMDLFTDVSKLFPETRVS